MRKLWTENCPCLLASGRLTLLLAVGTTLAAAPLPAQEKPVPQLNENGKAQPAKPVVPTLEELLAQALRDNPDIRVAETKLREAEAELNRARLQVTQKVVSFQHELEAHKSMVKEAEARLTAVLSLAAKGAAAAADVETAQQTLIRAKGKLAEIEAQLPYLLGKHTIQALAFSPDGKVLASGTGKTIHVWDPATGKQIGSYEGVSNLTEWLKGDHADVRAQALGALLAARSGEARHTLAAPLADKIRKMLDAPVTVDFKDRPPTAVLNGLQKTHGIPFVIHVKVREEPIELRLEQPVPVGAALQLLQDCVDPSLRFVVRDYGILVTTEKLLPPGAVLLQDFWKTGPREESTRTVPPERKP